jgi:uncharacterized beta barrel domain-containing protein DUF5777
MMTAFRTLGLLLALTALAPQLALAQAAPAAPATKDDDPDRDFNRSQPDFVVINLPTTLRVPKFKSAFRVTHRFGRPLGQGSFGSLAEDLFGLDSGAQIGLEYRFGLMRGLQVGIHRTSDRTIEFFTQYSLLQQADHGVGLGVIASIDGTNNFKDSYTPMIGVALSRELGRYGAVYVEPMYVNNSNLLPSELVDDNDTFMVGLGARIRVRPTVNIVAEFIPRSGNTPGVNHGTFGIEKVVGGHTFQLNFSDGFGTTMGQLARGGTAKDNWYLGFNISRKFF